MDHLIVDEAQFLAAGQADGLAVRRGQVEVLCWCGLPGLLDARVVDGTTVSSRETVVVADTPPAGNGALPSPSVRYQALCRRHYVRGRLAPEAAGPGQMALP